MKTVIKVILFGFLVGLMPIQVQALSLPMPCSLVNKYPRLTTFAAGAVLGATLGLSVFAAYKWFFGKHQSVVPNTDAQNLSHVALSKEIRSQIIHNCDNAGKNQISAIVYKNGYIALAYANTVKILDEQWNVCHEQKLADSRKIRALAFHPDKNILAIAAGPDKTFSLHIWDIDENLLQDIPQAQGYHKDTVCFAGMIFSPKGDQLIVSSDDCLITFWNTANWQYIDQIKLGHRHSCLNISFNKTGNLLAVGSSDFYSNCDCCLIIDVKSKQIKDEKIIKGSQRYGKPIFNDTKDKIIGMETCSVKDTAIVFHPTNPSLIAVSYCDLGNPSLGGLNRQSVANKTIQIIDIT